MEIMSRDNGACVSVCELAFSGNDRLHVGMKDTDISHHLHQVDWVIN